MTTGSEEAAAVLWAGPEDGRTFAGLTGPVLVVRRSSSPPPNGLAVGVVPKQDLVIEAHLLPPGTSRYLRTTDTDSEGRVIYVWDSPWPKKAAA